MVSRPSSSHSAAGLPIITSAARPSSYTASAPTVLASVAAAAKDVKPSTAALSFLDFVNASPTPFHAVAAAATLLEQAGFVRIRERDDWSGAVRAGGRYFLTREGSTIVAFAVGGRWRPGGPVAMVGAHTDSPCLRVKPVSRRQANGFMQVGAECYGGGLWRTWFDRDLALAGRLLVRDDEFPTPATATVPSDLPSSPPLSSGPAAAATCGPFVQKLVRIHRPVLRVPSLAIHLDRDPTFNPNKETEVLPIAGLVAAELNRTASLQTPAVATVTAEEAAFQPLGDISERHHPYVMELVAEHAGVEPSQIADMELVLYDTQRACLGGLHDEFVLSSRLDNLNMTYCAVMGLINSLSAASGSSDPGQPTARGGTAPSLEHDTTIRLAACFDHEEIGSMTAQGADSNLIPSVLRRLCALPLDGAGPDSTGGGAESPGAGFLRTLRRSFLVSADMAHSVHPSYAAKYEANHQPEMNRGPVVKINANARYASNAPGIVLVKEVARRAACPLQLFVVRNDSPCGSTIGPMLAAKTGVRTLDIGNACLAMHSIRETAGAHDVDHAIRLFEHFYGCYGELEEKILVD